jgi:hypothetical protein
MVGTEKAKNQIAQQNYKKIDSSIQYYKHNDSHHKDAEYLVSSLCQVLLWRVSLC